MILSTPKWKDDNRAFPRIGQTVTIAYPDTGERFTGVVFYREKRKGHKGRFAIETAGHHIIGGLIVDDIRVGAK